MTPRVAVLGAVAAAVATALSGLLTGYLATLAAAPVAVGLGAAALALRRGAHESGVRALVGLGGVALVLALALLLAGEGWAALLAAAAGLGVAVLGARLAYEDQRRALPAGPDVPPADARHLGAVAVDEAVLGGIALSRALRRGPGLAALRPALEAAAARYRERGWDTEPARAHPEPPPLEKADVWPAMVRGAGRAEHLRFASDYAPPDPEIREAWDAVAPNRTAHVHLWRHADGPRPTLVVLHGLGMGRIDWDARLLGVPWVHRQLGLDVAVPCLPLHGPRARGRRSGEGVLGDHPLHTNAAVGQALFELRRLVGWLRAQGAPAVGVYGVSLGGYLAALLASLDGRLACAVPALPPANLVDAWLGAEGTGRRRDAQAVGVTPELLDAAFAPHAPLRHTPRVAPASRLLVGALLDRICPPAGVHALWTHWERPALHWSSGSHLVPLDRAATRARVGAHLRDHLVAAAHAPELRVEPPAPEPQIHAEGETKPRPQPPLTRFR